MVDNESQEMYLETILKLSVKKATSVLYTWRRNWDTANPAFPHLPGTLCPGV